MIVLMRHAMTIGGAGYCIGRTAVPLSEEGREQAQGLVETLGRIDFARLCSSPSQRSMDTISPLAALRSKPVKVLPELDEIHMGAWDGLSFESIRQDFPDAYAERGRRFADFRPPNGENFSDVADRAMTALGALSTESQPTLILTHAGVIRSVLCRLTGRSMDDLFFFRPGHIQSTIVEATGDGLKFIATDILPEAIVSYL